VEDWEKTVRLSSPRTKRVCESSEVKLVANMEAETLRQSVQWQTKVPWRPGALRGWASAIVQPER
jgi:hypothetical protein